MSTSREDWNSYWRQQESVTKAYGRIADIYRRFIIPRSLKFTLRNVVLPGSTLLHAGAGSGEIDIKLIDDWNVVSVDFSQQAVTEHNERYAKNRQIDLISQADLFSLPFRDETFEAVFNLGVMEHFTDEQIVNALREMRRVTKTRGVLVLYWPPYWGLSVIALRIAKGVMQLEKRRGIILHPPEINLIRSRRQCAEWMCDAGLHLEQFSFGVGDFFTHQIIVARRTE